MQTANVTDGSRCLFLSHRKVCYMVVFGCVWYPLSHYPANFFSSTTGIYWDSSAATFALLENLKSTMSPGLQHHLNVNCETILCTLWFCPTVAW